MSNAMTRCRGVEQGRGGDAVKKEMVASVKKK
jgi:hypothetical protein